MTSRIQRILFKISAFQAFGTGAGGRDYSLREMATALGLQFGVLVIDDFFPGARDRGATRHGSSMCRGPISSMLSITCPRSTPPRFRVAGLCRPLSPNPAARRGRTPPLARYPASARIAGPGRVHRLCDMAGPDGKSAGPTGVCPDIQR